MEDPNCWMWLLQTSRGDFFVTVLGKWTQEEAATRVRSVFHVILELSIIGMIPRKRNTGPDEMHCTIYEVPKTKEDELGFNFLGGKKVWEICGRGAEYEAQLILLGKQGM